MVVTAVLHNNVLRKVNLDVLCYIVLLYEWMYTEDIF